MKIFEVTKKEIITAINGLDDSADVVLLDRVYNAVKHHEIDSFIDNITKGTLSTLDKYLKIAFNDIFMIHGIYAPYASIEEYFKLLETDRFGSERFRKFSEGTLYDIVGPKMANNIVFKNTLPAVLDASKGTASGFGKGELFFMLYGKNAKKLPSEAHADVDLDGWPIEIKGSGAGLHPGANKEGQNVNIVDKLNKRLLANADKFGIDLSAAEKKANKDDGIVNPENGWFPAYFTELASRDKKEALSELTTYLKDLYRMEIPAAQKMATAVLPVLGTPNAGNVWGSFVVNNSRAKSTWESVCAIDTDNGTFQYINIVDGNHIPPDLRLMPTLKKTKSTYAYPDGWIKVSIAPNYKFNLEAINRAKKDIDDVISDWNRTIKGKPNALRDKKLQQVARQIGEIKEYIDGKRPESEGKNPFAMTKKMSSALANIRQQTELVKNGTALAQEEKKIVSAPVDKKLTKTTKQPALKKTATVKPVKPTTAAKPTKLVGMNNAAKRKQVLAAELANKNSPIAQFMAQTKPTSAPAWKEKIDTMLKAGNNWKQIAAKLSNSDPTSSL